MSASKLFDNISEQRWYSKSTSNKNASGVLYSSYEHIRSQLLLINKIQLKENKPKRRASGNFFKILFIL